MTMAIHRKPLPKIIGDLSKGFWWQCPECDARGKQHPTYRDAFHDPDKYTHNCQRLTSTRETCPVCQQDIELDILGRFADHFETRTTNKHCPGYGRYPKGRVA